jgi:hypothetical protein
MDFERRVPIYPTMEFITRPNYGLSLCMQKHLLANNLDNPMKNKQTTKLL